MTTADVTRDQERRLAELRAANGALVAKSDRISTLRGLTALIAFGIAAVRLARPLPAPAWAIAGVAAAAFVALVVAHAILVTRMSELEARIRLVERSLARLRGEIAAFPERGDRFVEPGHPYAGDLDVLGASSLFQLLRTAETGAGERMLASWLLAPAPPSEIAARQAAARELAALVAFREDLALAGLQSGLRGRDTEPLLAWAERRPPKAGDPLPPRPNRALVRVAMALSIVTVASLVVTSALGAEQLGVLRHAWAVPFVAQLAALGALRPSLDPLLSIVGSTEEPFGRWTALFRRVEALDAKAPRLAQLRAALAGESGDDASRAIASLQRIVGFAELRHSGIVYLPANALLLWDVWCGAALDRWIDRFGGRVRAWIDALAEIEALASLGTFAHEHPSFAFPEVDDGPPRFEAEGLGHPLVPEAKRVVNDVSFGTAPAALMITGSNMSGKSTLLRAIGVASLLAQAGAPVCATRLRLGACRVHTSMRIGDSLERGVSHFYAELERLKTIVDAAGRGERVLFLLDEILHGTNSRERNIGGRAIVAHLVGRGAIGAVSSHDLGLAELERETSGRVRNVHLEEMVEGDRMTFDYKLKPGAVTTSNALRLMRLVGLDIALPGDP